MHEQQQTANGPKGQARELVDAAKQRTKRLAVEQKDVAAEQLASVARGLKQAADGMRPDNELAGRWAERAAESIEGFSARLRESDLDDMVAQGEEFARRNPALFIGLAATAGFLLGRFAKSSGGRRHVRSSPAAETPSPAAF